jgi:hypothetical protein
MAASVFANVILVVTKEFTEIFVISAFTMDIRASGGLFSQYPPYHSVSIFPARSSLSPMSTKSGFRRSRMTLPSAMNSGL